MTADFAVAVMAKFFGSIQQVSTVISRSKILFRSPFATGSELVEMRGEYFLIGDRTGTLSCIGLPS